MADQNEIDARFMTPTRYGPGSETGWASCGTVATAQSAASKRQDSLIPKSQEGDGIMFAVVVPDGVELEYTIAFYRMIAHDTWIKCSEWADLTTSKIVSRRVAGCQVAFKITAVTVTVGDLDETPLELYYKATGQVVED